MNDETLYAIFDSDFGNVVGFRFYRTYDTAEAYRLAYWPHDTYVCRIHVIQEVVE